MISGWHAQWDAYMVTGPHRADFKHLLKITFKVMDKFSGQLRQLDEQLKATLARMTKDEEK